MLAFPLLYAVAGSGEDLVEPRTYTQSLHFLSQLSQSSSFHKSFLAARLGISCESSIRSVCGHLFAIWQRWSSQVAKSWIHQPEFYLQFSSSPIFCWHPTSSVQIWDRMVSIVCLVVSNILFFFLMILTGYHLIMIFSCAWRRHSLSIVFF